MDRSLLNATLEEVLDTTANDATLPSSSQLAQEPEQQTVSADISSKEESETTKKDKLKQGKRFIPEHKKPDAALTFPEKLMNLMKFAEKQDTETFCVAWLADGKSFVVRNPEEFIRKVLPKFFKATKFSSFTRKLYRWGFRQVNRGIGPDDPIIFGNEFFQRDNLELMAKMRSVTAASTRKQEENNLQLIAQKRALETMDAEQHHKRIMLVDQLMQQQKANRNGFFQNNINLSQAFVPTNNGFGGISGMKPFDMFQPMNPQGHLMGAFPSNGLSGLAPHQGSQAYPGSASTAEIVNAAINALRYAP